MFRSLRVLGLCSLLLIGLAAQDATKYNGTWTSTTNGNGGKLTLQLMRGEDAVGKSTLSVSINAQEIPGTLKQVAWDGDNVTLRYAFVIDGSRLESTFRAKREGKRLTGTYQTRVPDGDVVDEGKIEAGE